LTLDFRNKIILGSRITQWVITTLTVFHRPIIFYTHCVPGPGYRTESAPALALALALADSTKSQTYITDLDTPRGASAQNRVHAQEVIDDNDMPGLCIRPYSAPSYGA
jgi:pantoate kinase